MAFTQKYLRCVENNEAKGVVPAKWTYYNANSDTVTTAGYCPKNCGLKAKDQVEVTAANGQHADRYYVAESSGTFTLTSMSFS